jgi:hypothetical protein
MRYAFIFLVLITVASCTEISFKEAQPKGIKKLGSFPASLCGKYVIPDDSSSRKQDTLIIKKDGYWITGGSERADWLDHGVLSDTIVLKKYKDYYFLNFYLQKQWVLRTFKVEKNQDIIMFEVNLSDEQTIQNLKTKLQPEVIKKESDTFYKVDPSPKELLDFIRANGKPQEALKKVK